MAATGCHRGSGSRLRSGPRGTLPHTSALLCSLSASQVSSISWPVLTRGEWRTRPALSHPRSPLALPRGPHEMLSVLRPHGGGHQGLSSFRGWFHNGSCGSSQMTGCAPGSGRRCGFKGRGLSVGPKPQFPLAAWWWWGGFPGHHRAGPQLGQVQAVPRQLREALVQVGPAAVTFGGPGGVEPPPGPVRERLLPLTVCCTCWFMFA